MYLNQEEMETLGRFDPEVLRLAQDEEGRQRETLSLIASENYMSPVVGLMEGSIFACKNASGYIGNRASAGCQTADALERLTIERCKSLFGCEHANVQSMSATIANVAVMSALLEPGDTVLGMRKSQGGHFSHGDASHISGRMYRAAFYGVDPRTECIDMDEVAAIARESRPKLIVCGTSSYPRLVDYERFGQIARSVGAYLLADIAHPVGLIAAKLIPSPVPHADVVTTSTHKTLRGPRGGGLIMCKKELAPKIDASVHPGLQGAPKMDMMAARAVLLKEAVTPLFQEYQRQVIRNAKALSHELRHLGMRVVTGGTDTHLVLVDVRSLVRTGRLAEEVLGSVGIVVGQRSLPYDPQPDGTSGIRLGSPALTTRGFEEEDIRHLAGLLVKALRNRGKDDQTFDSVGGEVRDLAKRHPLFAERWLPKYSCGF